MAPGVGAPAASAVRGALAAEIAEVVERAVFAFYRDRARREGIPAGRTGRTGRTGAVNRIQRFGSALNCDVHFHALLFDGVYAASSPLERPVFHPLAELADADVAHLTRTLRDRLLRLLRRRGLLDEQGEPTGGQEHEHQGLLPLLYAASIQGRVHYRLRRPWRDGTTHVVFDALVFLERLPGSLPAGLNFLSSRLLGKTT